MKKLSYLIIIQIVISITAGILVSQMSWIGKLGINLAYKEYAIFKSWPKTSALFFAIQLLVIGILAISFYKANWKNFVRTSLLIAVVAMVGLFATYRDFTHTFSHKLLKEKFHLGFYLFWLQWIISVIFFYIQKISQPKEASI